MHIVKIRASNKSHLLFLPRTIFDLFMFLSTRQAKLVRLKHWKRLLIIIKYLVNFNLTILQSIEGIQCHNKDKQ